MNGVKQCFRFSCVNCVLRRYYAIHEPLTYAQKRTATRMLVTIAIVYALSAAISVPQVLLRDRTEGVCGLSKDPAYVVASACGSFYVPCLILCFVYVKIYIAARNRLRKRRGPPTATSVRATGATQRGSDGSNGARRLYEYIYSRHEAPDLYSTVV